MTTQWKIAAVEVIDGATFASWVVDGEDGKTLPNPVGGTMQNTARVYGRDKVDIVLSSKTAEDDVIAAVWEALGADTVSDIEAEVEKRLADQAALPSLQVTFNADGTLKTGVAFAN
jgi:hypothetical protein